MTYKVLVHNHPSNGYKATALGLPDYVIEAATREAALLGIREAISGILAQSEIVEVDIPTDAPPIAATSEETFGMLRDDPTFDDFVAEVQHYRAVRNHADGI
ncbi:MAG: hypothetical protein H6637_02985 [Ardenticatenales bacterium]|nr:hypothetical protein [Ardenticatenales bacterium]